MFFTGHRDQSTPSTVYVTQNSNSSRETEEAGLLDPHDREVCIQSMERKRSHFLSFFLIYTVYYFLFAITFLWEIMVIYLFSLIKKNSLRKKKVIAYLGRNFFIAHANKSWLTVLWKNIQGKKIVYMKKFPGFFFSSKFSYMDKMGKILVFNWWNINFHNEMCIFFFSIDEM